MKFLTKNPLSEILQEALNYKSGSDNSYLRLKLLNEQKNFCAYTEKYVAKIDSVDLEHFDPSKKDADDYYNYYSTLRYANEQKISKYEKYKNCTFFKTLFFHDIVKFTTRIAYNDFIYEAIDVKDQDATDLINYLGFNEDYLFGERLQHIKRLKSTISSFTEDQKKIYFKENKNDLSFITAIEYEFKIDLTQLINE